VLTLLISVFFVAGAFMPDHHAGKVEEQNQQKWVRLFDGKTLNGWHTIPGGEWKVEEGSIMGLSNKEDQRHGLLVTDKKYRDFEVQTSLSKSEW
jgi:hypothetical protein